MPLRQEDIDMVVEFVRFEPKTIQDISKHIGRSWVTTDTYVNQIKNLTGRINIKVFRGNTRGALKVVYYTNPDVSEDSVKDALATQIRSARKKTDFDFFELFQYVNDDSKRLFFNEVEVLEEDLADLFSQADDSINIFSGNLSFINLTCDGRPILEIMEDVVKKGVKIKILCRVTVSSSSNITKMLTLMKKYPRSMEIRHTYQPLRGYIIDDRIMRFRNEELMKDYKKEELNKNLKIFYEITDKSWVAWLNKLFWSSWRFSIDYEDRYRQLEKYF